MEKVARWKWHVRGNWSSQDDRIPSAVWLAILWIGMIAGFALDAQQFLDQNPPLLLHAHAATFTIWMCLLTAQLLLVLKNRLDIHRKLGWFLVAWACLMAIMGPVGVYTAIMMQVKAHGPFPYPFITVHLVDIGGFLLFLAIGIAMRKNPAAHKRMMILSTVALADPGFARLLDHLIHGKFINAFMSPHPPSAFVWFLCVFNGNILLVALMLAWDWWKGRLIRIHVIASISLLICMYFASVIYFMPSWQALTLQWVTAWAK